MIVVEFPQPAPALTMNSRSAVPYRNRPRSTRGVPRETLLRFLKADTDECLLWPHAIGPQGYGRIAWDGTTRSAYRVMCELAHGPQPEPLLEVAHSCGVRACVNPRHLRWATRRDNALDRDMHGTMARGEKGPSAKLTADQAREIRRRRAAGERPRDLSREFGVHPSNIHAIATGRSWKGLL